MVKIFSSTVTNKVDDKGRVSVPATFRRVIEGEGGNTLYLLRDPGGEKALLGCGEKYFNILRKMVFKYHPNSDQGKKLHRRIFGGTEQIPLDDTGRIVLPMAFRQKLAIDSGARFVGMGMFFHIWKPEDHDVVTGDEDDDDLIADCLTDIDWNEVSGDWEAE